MKIVKTYLVKRNGNYIWTSEGYESTDEVLNERDMVIADEGKILVLNGEIIGKGIWLKDTQMTDYDEINEPIEEDIEEEEEEI